MLIEYKKAYTQAIKWADARGIKAYLLTCYICHKEIKEDQPAELVYTKRKDWHMMHRSCIEKEITESWRH